MKKYIVACDICKVETGMKYNGEHYLCPEEWYELYDDHRSRATGLHICSTCFVYLTTKPKTSNESSSEKGK